MTLVALAFGTLSAQADDDEVEEMTVTAPYDPLWLYGFGIFVGGNLGGGAPETGPRTHETFCGSEEDQDSPECQEDEDD